MNQLMSKLRTLAAIMASVAMMTGVYAVSAPEIVHANGTCPITVNEEGSTTVGPALVQAQAGFQAATGCTLNIVQDGSGAGIAGLNNYATTGDNIAASSTPLTAAQLATAWEWQIGNDAMVIAVQHGFCAASGPGITVNQVQGIYNGTITDWHTIDPTDCAMGTTIVPRSRIVGSG